MSSDSAFEYQQKNMVFRRLGSSGLRVPIFALGGWHTLFPHVYFNNLQDIVKTALENGINMFDEAENYTGGKSEREMQVKVNGRVLRELKVRRSDIVITSKVFFGTRPGPNNTGLSRKHIIEGVRESLQRLQTDYLDIIFAHRPDSTVPMLEIVRAFSWVIEQGMAFYWGTSEWSVAEIEEACRTYTRYFFRARLETEYAPLYKKYETGATVYSALAGGMLTGKYNDGIPEDSRFHTNKHLSRFSGKESFLCSEEGQHQILVVRALTRFAEEKFNCSVAHLALAWVARNPNTNTIILGATKPDQIVDNLRALEIIPKLTPEILEEIEQIVKNKPAPPPPFGRPALDPCGRP
ncbi:Aldo/keto reductase [Vararia minispora EC-137]|uniref:Aldo/keto reductase n=1 Tax=Vararia minispora EC-137 TaxID=1314806 RepID=A0ACB8QR01_9AGAM|nr:Aldo/keto reductase [Vararia minispora EC-137]